MWGVGCWKGISGLNLFSLGFRALLNGNVGMFKY